MGVEVITFGKWDVHISATLDGYRWAVSSAWGLYGSGFSDTLEQAKADALDKFIGMIDEWRSDAIRAREALGGAAAKE